MGAYLNDASLVESGRCDDSLTGGFALSRLNTLRFVASSRVALILSGRIGGGSGPVPDTTYSVGASSDSSSAEPGCDTCAPEVFKTTITQ